MSDKRRKEAEITGSDSTGNLTLLMSPFQKRKGGSAIRNNEGGVKRNTKQSNKKFEDAVDDIINSLTHLTPIAKKYFRYIIEEFMKSSAIIRTQNNIPRFLEAKFNLKGLQADADATISGNAAKYAICIRQFARFNGINDKLFIKYSITINLLNRRLIQNLALIWFK